MSHESALLSNNPELATSANYLLSEEDATQRAHWYLTHSFDIDLVTWFKDAVDTHKSQDHALTLLAGERAFEASQRLDSEALALGHWTYALALAATGAFEQALAHFTEAQGLYQQDNRVVDAARVGVRQIQVLATLGQHQEALALAERCRQVFTQHESPLELAQVEVNSGIVLSILGQAEASREALLRALPLMQQKGDQAGVAAIYVNLGYSYQDQDAFAEAESYFQQALVLFEALGQTASIAGTKVNIALLYRRQGRLAQALTILSECQQLYQRLGHPPDADLAKLEQARVSLDLNLLSEAESLARSLILSFNQRTMMVEANEAREVLAHSMLRLGRQQQAHRLWQEVQETWQRIGNPAQAVQAQLVLLRLRIDAAPIGSLILRELSHLVSRLEDYAMPLAHAYALCLLARLHLKQQNLEQAQQVLATARELGDSLGLEVLQAHIAWHLAKLAHVQQDYQTAESYYLTALDGYQQQQDRLAKDDLRASYDNDKKELYQDYLRLLLEQQAYQRAFLFSDHSKAKLLLDLLHLDDAQSIKPVQRVEDLRVQVPAGSIILAYLVIQEQLYVFVISPDVFRYYSLGDIGDVEEQLAQFHFFSQRLSQGGMYHHIYSHDYLQERLHLPLGKLYRTLLMPITELSQANHVTIVPHAILHRLPFAALFDGQGYFGDNKALSMIPSCAFYRPSQSAYRSDNLLISAFGPALDEQLAINQEMQTILKHLPEALIFTDDGATTKAFFEQSQRAHIIHIATHGAFRHDNPMYSGFHLSDGWINLQDIHSQHLKADLVVLATCESGLSQGLGLDEQFGLTRGFLAAGASSILATLWPISGHVSVQLIDHFYHYLAQGDSVAVALQQAQRALRQEFPEVYDWAAFCLVGDPYYHIVSKALTSPPG